MAGVLAEGFRVEVDGATDELVLASATPRAARHFTTARSLAAHALRDFAIEVEVVELPVAVRAGIVEARGRQYR